MCGIHLIVDKQGSLDESAISRMVDQSVHRGPDDKNILKHTYDNKNWFFGVNRLRITDLSHNGAQPMRLNNSTLLFNGEVYNYQKLKSDLIHSRMISSSDTEVMIHLLDREGLEVLKDIEGMYGLIYFDEENQTVHLARDSMGMKPLYYWENENYFIASSEIKSILSSGLVEKDLNESAIEEYLSWKYVNPPQTFYKGIFEVLPGEKIHVSNKVIHIEPVTISPEMTDLSDEKLTDKASELLHRSIQKHIPSNQSYALMLSGGIDSTLTLAMLQQMGIEEVPVYSFVSSKEDAKFGTEDWDFSRKAAKQFNAKHHIIETDKESTFSCLDEYIESIDQPIGDSAGIMTWLLSKEIGKDHKIALSGAGADELFAGYNRHAAYYRYLKYRKFLTALKPAANFVGLFDSMGNDQIRMIYRFLKGLDRSPSQTFYNFCQLRDLSKSTTEHWAESQSVRENLSQALTYDLTHFLVSDVLAINDSMGMRSSVEIRSPYLDQTLVNWSRSVPPETKLKHGKKWILSRILKDLGGEEYVNRKKQGFGLPLRGWIDKRNENLWSFDYQNFILHKFVSKEKITGLLEAHHKSQNYSSELWALLVLGKWLVKEFYE